MLMLKQASIRDCIAFPKTSTGADLMLNAPTPVSEIKLKDYGLQVIKKAAQKEQLALFIQEYIEEKQYITTQKITPRKTTGCYFYFIEKKSTAAIARFTKLCRLCYSSTLNKYQI